METLAGLKAKFTIRTLTGEACAAGAPIRNTKLAASAAAKARLGIPPPPSSDNLLEDLLPGTTAGRRVGIDSAGLRLGPGLVRWRRPSLDHTDEPRPRLEDVAGTTACPGGTRTRPPRNHPVTTAATTGPEALNRLGKQ